MASRSGIAVLSAVGIALATLGASGAQADNVILKDARPKAERDHERADELRRRSAERAKSALGEQSLPEDETQGQSVDFNALSMQIRRLGEVLRQLGDAAAQSAKGLVASDSNRRISSIAPSVSENDLAALYGPDGPTERSVRALLEHRIVVHGNPRLKAGAVKSTPEGIVAEVVTVKEGALVERYVVDRKSGLWMAKR